MTINKGKMLHVLTHNALNSANDGVPFQLTIRERTPPPGLRPTAFSVKYNLCQFPILPFKNTSATLAMIF
jgi:hypothetical protein